MELKSKGFIYPPHFPEKDISMQIKPSVFFQGHKQNKNQGLFYCHQYSCFSHFSVFVLASPLSAWSSFIPIYPSILISSTITCNNLSQRVPSVWMEESLQLVLLTIYVFLPISPISIYLSINIYLSLPSIYIYLYLSHIYLYVHSFTFLFILIYLNSVRNGTVSQSVFIFLASFSG